MSIPGMQKYNQLTRPDPNGVTIIDYKGNSKWIPTPFIASCHSPTNNYKAGTTFCINEVGFNSQGQMMFVLDEKVYPAEDFEIVIYSY